MVYALSYRRPGSVDSGPPSERTSDDKKRSIDGSTAGGSQHSGVSHGIPDALSFDRIVAGGTCPVGVTASSRSPCCRRSVSLGRTALAAAVI